MAALNDALSCLVERPGSLSAEVLRQILDSLSEVVLVVARDSTIVYANPAYHRVLGVPVAKVVGRRIADIEPGAAILEVLKTGEPRKQGVTRIHSVGGLDCFGDAIPLYEGNRLIGAAGVFQDVAKVLRLKDVAGKLQAAGDAQPVYASASMRQVLDRAERVGQVESTVLITGESGVGKQVVAQYIHRCSRRSSGPFVSVNCGAIPENLLESELFGYRPGAFTGAAKGGKPGLFAVAEGGTLFLDEVGDLPLALQVKLLKVLQEREYTPIGGVKPVHANARVLAATNRDLAGLVQQRLFREDLFYRLNVIPLHIPPLRERVEEIRTLAEAFLQRLRERYGLVRRLSPQVLEWMEHYTWPGNVRELENVVERLAVLAEGAVISLGDLALAMPHAAVPAEVPKAGGGRSILRESVEETERQLIVAALKLQGSARRAAAYLGIDPATLIRKARRYGVVMREGVTRGEGRR